jgi:predicted O-methyltransferase YrrM
VYSTVEQEEGLSRFFRRLSTRPDIFETGLTTIQQTIRDRQGHLPVNPPFSSSHNGDTLLGRLCYLAARAMRPTMIVETGVCYGVTSAHLLQALTLNEGGHLHSIDLPPLSKDADAFVGWVIPDALRERWTLHRGSSARVLRPLLSQIGQLDLFIHDSLHTYRNMKMEFAAVWPCLRPGGVLISDDVEGNTAFSELVKQTDVALSIVIRENHKPSLLGVALKKA